MTTTATLRMKLAQTEANIVTAKKFLEILNENKTLLLQQLAIVATFPVLTLPVEITQEIFIQCLPFDQCRPFVTQVETHTPLTLLGVCREWRDIALSTPELWAALSLHFDPVPSGVSAPKLNQVNAYIEKWLDRATNRPLSLCFERETDDDSVGECSFPPARMGDIIRQYSSRIEYLELALSQIDIGQLELNDLKFPLLQRVSFGHVYGADPDSDNPVEGFAHAPQLRSLCLEEYTSFEYYPFPSWQLTTFDGTISSMELFYITPNLLEAKCIVEHLHPLPTSAVHHPGLEFLTFTPNTDIPVDILPYLNLPSLRYLDVSEMEDATHPSLLAFLTRSAPPLTTLCIHADDGFADSQECISVVDATLENLELASPSRKVQDAILRLGDVNYPLNQRIEPAKTSPCLLKLKALSFLQSEGVDYDVLVRFLKKRYSGKDGIAKLESFRLVWRYGTFLPTMLRSGPAGDPNSRTLRRLKEEGLDIHVGTNRKNHLH
ncbi:hypothetical protein C8F04DRAFT_1241914 [Mycena alexandri]|uniref:F-box domain-containing protein n=1 Tax=Mycena alexandri TaxID=1745969 RepID=A0AAD6S5L9_9AGAR|nr:hypothetical protein C8F04DRAFT_1241914 [Mycena alexandri]